jgi:ubiquitin C-terminal hydrolase
MDSLISKQTSQPSGIPNIGNTCYINALTQFLRQIFRTPEYENSRHPLLALINADEPWRIRQATQQVTMLLGSLSAKFRGNRQQDPHEALLFLQPGLREAIQSSKSRSNLFKVGVVSKTRCESCLTNGASREEDEGFITLGISDNTTLEDCLRDWHKKEDLTRANTWTGCTCAANVPRRKQWRQMSFARLPDKLILILKRFAWEGASAEKRKNSIQYPLTGLDLSPYTTEGCGPEEGVYDLCSTIQHHGETITSGHCTANVLVDSQWYHCNDMRVGPVQHSHRDVYCLLYQRRQKAGVP